MRTQKQHFLKHLQQKINITAITEKQKELILEIIKDQVLSVMLDYQGLAIAILFDYKISKVIHNSSYVTAEDIKKINQYINLFFDNPSLFETDGQHFQINIGKFLQFIFQVFYHEDTLDILVIGHLIKRS